MANQVTAPINNYFEKVLYENSTFEIPPLWFLMSVPGRIPTSDLIGLLFLCNPDHLKKLI
jgi:hypothetical protein